MTKPARVEIPDYESLVKRVKAQFDWPKREREVFGEIICLVNQEGALPIDAPVRLDKEFTDGPVSHYPARADGPTQEKPTESTEDDIIQVRKILGSYARSLAPGKIRGLGWRSRLHGIARFSRFDYVEWLLEETTPPNGSALSRAELQKELQKRDLFLRLDLSTISGLLGLVGAVLGLVGVLVGVLVGCFWPAFAEARISGKSRLSGRLYRWFVDYSQESKIFKEVFEGCHRDFPAIAKKIVCEKPWKKPDDILTLLVGAFMADVRAAYQARSSRTARCTLLLSNGTAHNGGLPLINAVLRERKTFSSDPFLIVAQCDGEPTAPANPKEIAYLRLPALPAAAAADAPGARQ